MACIVILGDSNSAEAEYRGFDNWVTLLRKSLSREDEVYNLAIDGETSTGILERMDVECKARNPDVIIVLVGTNDASVDDAKKGNRTSIKDFENNILEVIQKSRKFTDRLLFIGLPTCNDAVTMPFLNNESLREYNSKIRAVCEKENVLFLDLFYKMEVSCSKNLLDEDGIHLNNQGHQKVFELVKQKLTGGELL